MAYSKTAVPVLRIDAQFSVIEAALKGYSRWLSAPGNGQVVRNTKLWSSCWADNVIGKSARYLELKSSGLV